MKHLQAKNKYMHRRLDRQGYRRSMRETKTPAIKMKNIESGQSNSSKSSI